MAGSLESEGQHVHGTSLSNLKKFLKKDIPTILFYGDSHMSNLQDWLEKCTGVGKPRELDKKVLELAFFCNVGGSRFDTIHDRVCNVEVPETQPDRGDQWQNIITDPTCRPDYIIISLGGNDADEFGKKLGKKLANSDIDPNEFYNKEYLRVTEQMDIVFDRLGNQFQNAQLIFMAIMDRDNWSVTTKQFAQDLTFYVKKCWKIKVMQISGKITPYHMKRDHILSEAVEYFQTR